MKNNLAQPPGNAGLGEDYRAKPIIAAATISLGYKKGKASNIGQVRHFCLLTRPFLSSRWATARRSKARPMMMMAHPARA
jgi:hypothetical protein